MLVCKQCKKPFPHKMMIDGKIRQLSTRMYCIECSPFNHHNTKQLDCVINSTCKSCGKPTQRGRSMCFGCHTTARRYKIKKAAVAYKGGQCERCGWSGLLCGYDFHHRDGNEKEFAIGASFNRKLSDIKKELDKCELLCALCHRAEHSGVNAEMETYINASRIDFYAIEYTAG